MSALFAGPTPRVRAVPASAPFLDVFVEAMAGALWRADAPFALADALVLLPNRRAAQGLIDAFARKLGGAALLPTIRPLGDLDDDPDVWGAEPIELDIAPAIAPTRRRLELAALARARLRAEGGADDPARALAMADELCRLLDSAAAADAPDWAQLPHLVEDIDLAAHWKMSAEFLEIITVYWPQRLKAEGLADPAERRALVLDGLGGLWRSAPPERPIIIAGSTGSIAATRRLMRVVASLPQGVVVLPGLDSDLDDAAWNAIGPQHPQFALKETLAALGLARTQIASLGKETQHGHARRTLIREALAPADATADWLKRLESAGGGAMAKKGLEGAAILEAANADEEAAAIALLLREALETPGQTAAFVTPDAPLARRVGEKLQRWGVTPSASHGRALRETPPGMLLALLCDLARDSGDCVALAALLKHPLARFGLTAEEGARLRPGLERLALRGPRRHETCAEIVALCQNDDGALDLAQRLVAAVTPLTDAPATLTLDAFAEALAQCAELVAAETDGGAPQLWVGRAGETAAGVVRDLVEEGAALGAMAKDAAARAFLKVLDGREAAPPGDGDPRCAIWSPLEARLQRRDVMILGGLNEGVWPAPPPEDAFLSRAMRNRLGLPSPDARIGLAAHDFAQLACAPRLVLTRALKQGGAPALASRWLWRLKTLLKGAGLALAPADHALAWARALDAPERMAPLKPPRPAPPAEARLQRISVTEVETLIRDPYAVYARRILGLEVLKPVGYEPGAAERGSAIHKAIEEAGDGADLRALMAALDQALKDYGFGAVRRAAERARLAPSARAWLAWAARREGAVYLEKWGELALAGGRRLVGRADRIEIAAPHHAVIVDVKTGAPPSDDVVKSGLAPQLPLEAAMLARSAFADTPRARAEELIYWRFGGAAPAPRSVKLDGAVAEAGEEALARLESLLAAYARPEQPFLSKPRVQFVREYADYDHLARRKEWGEAEGE